MLGEDVSVAHCLYITGHSEINMAGDSDLKLLGESGTTVAHCPYCHSKRRKYIAILWKISGVQGKHDDTDTFRQTLSRK